MEKQIQKSFSGTCAKYVDFVYNVDTHQVYNIHFTGGCDGNLKALALFCNGLTAEKIIDTVLGNTCGIKKTSCMDQFAKTLKDVLMVENNICYEREK